MTREEIKRLVDEVKADVIAWRRHLHAHPELSFQEEKTAQFVFETLQSFGHLELSRPTKTSVMARLVGKQPGRVVAIRADMDALPIQEENTFEFASKHPGVMHACGHDGHTAMLLGTAKIFSQLRDAIRGEIRFLFQHAEELFPGGAEEMVQAGVMDGVDVVIGTHLWSPLERGKVGIVYGPMMAAPDRFFIRIIGKGGHGAMPHQTIDAIAIGAQVVTNLQHIVSRYVDPIEPLVVSVTQFVAGTAHNVLPGEVEIQGTVRTFDDTLRRTVPQWMERIVKGITEAHGASYEFQFDYGYRPVINHDEVTRVIEETARELLGDEAVARLKPNMGGEDFSAFLQKAPGSFFYVGARNEEKGIVYPHHHPRFTIDEDALEIGVQLFVGATLKLLAEAE